MCLNRHTRTRCVGDCIGTVKPAAIVSFDLMMEFVIVMVSARVSVENCSDD